MKLTATKVFAVSCVAAIGILAGFWFTRVEPPEIQEVAREPSPSSRWSAKVEMVVYGDHWFVNDARYEVRIGPVGSRDAEVVVYSTPASGPSDLSVKWVGDDELVIKDSASALGVAVKQPRGQWFELWSTSTNSDSETADGATRSNLRLHPVGPLGLSEGCVTVCSGYDNLRQQLLQTPMGTVPGTNRTYYGILTVTGSR